MIWLHISLFCWTVCPKTCIEIVSCFSEKYAKSVDLNSLKEKKNFSLNWEIVFSFHLWYKRRGFWESPPPPHFEIKSWTLLSPHTALPFGKTYWIRAWFYFFSWRVVWTEAHLLYMFLLFLLFPTFCCYLASHVFIDLIVCNCWTCTSLFRIPWVFKMLQHLLN